MADRIAGEKKRALSLLAMLRAHIDAAEDHIVNDLPSSSTRQALTMTACSLAERMAAIDAMREARPSTKRHAVRPDEQCERWCEACAENTRRGFNPDGTRREEGPRP